MQQQSVTQLSNLPENSLPARLTCQQWMLHGSCLSSSHLPVSASNKCINSVLGTNQPPWVSLHQPKPLGISSPCLNTATSSAFIRISDLEMQPFCIHVEPPQHNAHVFPLDPLGSRFPPLTGIAVFDKHTVKYFTVLFLYEIYPRSLPNVARSQVKFQCLKTTQNHSCNKKTDERKEKLV